MTDSRVALVTGSSRGIGYAIAESLAVAGCTVVMNYLSNEVVARTAFEGLKEKYPEKPHTLMPFDVSNPKEVLLAVESIEQKFGCISILVNNAGIAENNLLLRVKDSEIERQLNVNLLGPIYCCRQVLRKMIKQKWGRIINVGSVAGDAGHEGQSIYSATKSGLLGFTKSLAKEVSSRNITANVVSPGAIQSDMTAALTKPQLENLKNLIPSKQLGRPEDIAALVQFLTSDRAGYITGQILSVNGGLHM